METKSYITITGLVSGRTYGKPPIYKPTLRVCCKGFIKTPIMGRMGQSALHCASDVENPWACALATPLDSVPCPFGKNRAAGLVYPIYIYIYMCVYIYFPIYPSLIITSWCATPLPVNRFGYVFQGI